MTRRDPQRPPATPWPGTFLHRAWQHASAVPSAPLYAFVNDAGHEVAALTAAETLARAQGVAVFLREQLGIRPAEPLLLVFPPGIEFVPALIGCIMAGAIPVPAYPPDPLSAGEAEGLAHLCADAGARFALTTTWYDRMRSMGGLRRRLRDVRWPELTWVPIDRARAERPDPATWARADSDSTLLLQYTSGSTSEPRGVQITHGNVLHQLEFSRSALDGGPGAHAVMWMPQYHDFGLISGILSALLGNWRLTFLSPLSFIKRPRVWFDTIHRVRATHTAAPDFGYSLAARKIPAELVKTWDLSCLRVAMSAAEPIRADTIEAFVARFADSRFARPAFCPAYGLAEHTVGVTVGGRGFVAVSRASLAHGRIDVSPGDGAVLLARCGRPENGIAVRIVDPVSARPSRPEEVGEIWVHSESVALGYWRRPEETARTFGARLIGDERSWLRTGDLGFLHDGEVVVCGRLKDVVIIRGRNLYPQDLEQTVQRAHQAIRPGNVIAFSTDRSGREELVLVAEVRDGQHARASLAALAGSLAQSVATAHAIRPAEVILLAPGRLPKTTSGKVQRQRCRALCEQGTLDALLRWSPTPGGTAEDHQRPVGDPSRTLASAFTAARAIAPAARQSHLIEALKVVVSTLTGLGSEALDPSIPLQAQGADSIAVAELARTLEESTGAEIPLTVMVAQGSLARLSDWLLRHVLRLEFTPLCLAQDARPTQARALGNRRRDPAHTRVAIIGGGVAGLEAARTLRLLGYRHVTVYEADAEVGGKVRSVHHGGRAYELGQLAFLDSYTHTLPLLHDSGLATVAGRGRPCSVRSGTVAAMDLERAGRWAEQVQALSRQGADAPASSRPISEWLKASGAGPLPPPYQLYWTAFGYGYAEDVPAVYLLDYLRLLPRITIAIRAEDGNQGVWTSLASRLEADGVRIRRGCPVVRVDTSPLGPVTIMRAGSRPEGADEADEADEVVFACPPWAVARMLPAPGERALFERFRSFDYRAVVIEVDGLLDREGSVALLDGIEDRTEPGGLLCCMRLHDDRNVYVANQFGSPPGSNLVGVLSDDELDARIAKDLERQGARLVRILDRARWRYFPHLSAEDLALGTRDEIESLQGHEGRWFVGSYLSFEVVEATAAHAAELIRQGFGPDQPRTAADRVDDAIKRHLAVPRSDWDSDAGADLTAPQRTLSASASRVPMLAMTGVAHIEGITGGEPLRLAVQRQVDRLEGLRLRVHKESGQVSVRLHAQGPRVEVGWSYETATEPYQAWCQRFLGLRMGGPEMPGAVFALCALGPRHHAVALNINHLLMDAIGQTWMMRLLADACTEVERGEAAGAAGLRPIATSHGAILERERTYRSSGQREADRAYWRAHLSELFPTCEPTSLAGPSEATAHALFLTPLVRRRVRRSAEASAASASALYVAAGLFCRWERAGRPAGRMLVDFRSTSRQGLYDGGIEPQQRSFPIGVVLSPERSISALLAELRDHLADGVRHSALDGDELLQLLAEQGHKRAFLWDVNVFPMSLSARVGSARLRMEVIPPSHHEHRASFRVIEDVGSGAVQVMLLHRHDELDQAEGARMLERFAHVLDVLTRPSPPATVASLLQP